MARRHRLDRRLADLELRLAGPAYYRHYSAMSDEEEAIWRDLVQQAVEHSSNPEAFLKALQLGSHGWEMKEMPAEVAAAFDEALEFVYRITEDDAYP